MTGTDALNLLLGVVRKGTLSCIKGHGNEVFLCPDGVECDCTIGCEHFSFQRIRLGWNLLPRQWFTWFRRFLSPEGEGSRQPWSSPSTVHSRVASAAGRAGAVIWMPSAGVVLPAGEVRPARSLTVGSASAVPVIAGLGFQAAIRKLTAVVVWASKVTVTCCTGCAGISWRLTSNLPFAAMAGRSWSPSRFAELSDAGFATALPSCVRSVGSFCSA